MNKQDIFKKLKFSRKDQALINQFLLEVQNGIKSDEKLVIQGIGSFKTYVSKGRNYYNPHKKEVLKCEDGKRVRFIPSKQFRRTP